ncbi:hypothetical protein DXG01_008253 [Tephrocybe rancida]|nr:hypothetical protein DXG01_008253 [Tephrocybe rancida]
MVSGFRRYLTGSKATCRGLIESTSGFVLFELLWTFSRKWIEEVYHLSHRLECQNKDWPPHKRECSALQEWSKAAPSADLAVPSDAVRCLGRLMWTRQKKGLDSNWTKEIDALQSHRESLQTSSFELHTHLSHALVRYLGVSSPEQLSNFELNSPRDLVDIISRFITNTFSVTTPTLTPIGASVSPVVALINHSCEPNAVVVFPRSSESSSAQEPLMQVVALRSIEPDEECRAVLKNTDAVLDAVRVGQEALGKATALQFKDPIKARQLTSNLIPILISSGLTPSSHPLLALSRLHQSLLIDSLPSPLTQELLDDAIRATTRSTTGLSAILQPGHPVRGIALAELAKLLAVDEPSPRQGLTPAEAALQYPPSGPPRLKLALDTMLRARNELLVGFGAWNGGGQAGKELREGIVALEKEVAVWKQGVKNVLQDTPKPVTRRS